MNRRRYRFDMRSAYESGATLHPQIEIRKVAPHAYDFEPVSIADCWLFSAESISDCPAYITDITELQP